MNDPAVIERLLRDPGRWAVVGLSRNPQRVAYAIAVRLLSLGKEIVAIHPRAEDVHDAPAYARLGDVPGRLDVVDVFVNSSRAGAIVDEAIAVGARAVWLQLGVVDHRAAWAAEAAGLDVVMDRCPAIEAARLGMR